MNAEDKALVAEQQRKRDRSFSKTRRQYAEWELKLGGRPKYIALKYGLVVRDPEKLEQEEARWREQKGAK